MSMKILELEILNNKEVRCFKLRLDGKNMTVAGYTGTGKTTAVSALWEILKKCPDALTHGTEKGSIKVKLSDGSKTITATRVTTKKASTLTITDHEGDKITMADFEKLISTLSVNPHQIIDMKPTEQLRTLAAAADIGDVDLGALDTEIKEAEDLRLSLFRDAELIEPGEEPDKVEPVDLNALIKEQQDSDRHNEGIRLDRENLDRINERGLDNKESIVNLEENIRNLEAEKERLVSANDELREKGKAVGTKLKKMKPVDTTDIEGKISEANETNEKAGAHIQWRQARTRHANKLTAHGNADKQVKTLRASKKKILADAKWPLPDLSIEDGQIIYKGCLLSNLGTSEQMIVCSAIAIKDILAHPLHVARLDGIEAMSREDCATLFNLFNGHDIQVLATRVSWGDTEPDEIVITDGVYEGGE